MSVEASGVLAATAFWVAAAIVFSLFQIRYDMDRQNESVVTARIIEGHEPYTHLAQVFEHENSPAADESAAEMRDAYRFLHDMQNGLERPEGDYSAMISN